jgi:GH18 family chitinase
MAMTFTRFVAGVLLLTACRTARPPAPPSAPAALTGPFRIVGYLPSWRGPDVTIPYQRLTHLNYAFALPTPSGGLTDVPAPDRLAAVVTAAHAAGVKVCLSIGGWHDGDDSAFELMAADAGTRAAFVAAGMAAVAAHDLDGLDIDWEYPDRGASADNFVRLMAELAARLHPTGKLLTAAVVAMGAQGEGILPQVFASTDFINVMAYDADESGHSHHSPFDYAVASLRYWRDRGLPRDKLVLGVPFYGRPPSTSYRDLFRLDPRAHEKDQIGAIGYNGIATIKRKTTLALAEASGIMIWEITEDTSDETSLLRAIDETARH